MIRFLVAAPQSGSGKTTLTCGLLAVLKRRGLAPCAFKCGPDYIDPMFHRAILGVESRNLDLFFMEEEALRRQFSAGCAGHDAVVCEGVMGYYDGVGGSTDRASAWHVASTLDLPVILALRPAGTALTLAAQLQGLCRFRADSRIVGVVFNHCSPALAQQLGPMVERETGLAALGCLPPLPQAGFESRHLGLYTAGEITDLSDRIALLADALEEHVDMERLLRLCDDGVVSVAKQAPKKSGEMGKTPARIAVASDKAFCFTYTETLELLEGLGAEMVPFSPLKDAALPENIGGLYLPGGYPELYAGALSKNSAMRQSIHRAVVGGLPTVAECGGFLYLGRELEDTQGQVWPMAEVLPGSGVKRGKLLRFGYAKLTARGDSLLLRAGEAVPVHEFHHWDSTENGDAFDLEKPVSAAAWQGGFATDTLYAAFAHLYLPGYPALAERFVTAARNYGKSGGTQDEA